MRRAIIFYAVHALFVMLACAYLYETTAIVRAGL